MENEITKEELALINRYARKELSGDEVYVFSVVLCDNDVDRDFERFSDEALEKMAELFVGVTGIYDHQPSAKNQVARIFSCRVETVEGKLNACSEQYKRLVARAYIPICESSGELIKMLDSGIKKEVSVGCGIGSCACSICGEDMRLGKCEHVKGKMYKEKLCCGILEDPTDAYEWSFIAVPSQRKAGVIKSFYSDYDCGRSIEAIGKSLGREELESLKEYIAGLREKADEGERYKSSLRLEAVKAGITARVGIESSLLEKMVSALSVDELLRLKSCFEKAAEKLYPMVVQTAVNGESAAGFESERAYRI